MELLLFLFFIKFTNEIIFEEKVKYVKSILADSENINELFYGYKFLKEFKNVAVNTELTSKVCKLLKTNTPDDFEQVYIFSQLDKMHECSLSSGLELPDKISSAKSQYYCHKIKSLNSKIKFDCDMITFSTQGLTDDEIYYFQFKEFAYKNGPLPALTKLQNVYLETVVLTCFVDIFEQNKQNIPDNVLVEIGEILLTNSKFSSVGPDAQSLYTIQKFANILQEQKKLVIITHPLNTDGLEVFTEFAASSPILTLKQLKFKVVSIKTEKTKNVEITANSMMSFNRYFNFHLEAPKKNIIYTALVELTTDADEKLNILQKSRIFDFVYKDGAVDVLKSFYNAMITFSDSSIRNYNLKPGDDKFVIKLHNYQTASISIESDISVILKLSSPSHKLFLKPTISDDLYVFKMNLLDISIKEFHSKSGNYTLNVVPVKLGLVTEQSTSWELGIFDIQFFEQPLKFAYENRTGPVFVSGNDYIYPEIPQFNEGSIFLGMVMCCVILITFSALFLIWSKLGFHIGLMKENFSINSIVFHISFLFIFTLYIAYWLKLDMFTTLKILFFPLMIIIYAIVSMF